MLEYDFGITKSRHENGRYSIRHKGAFYSLALRVAAFDTVFGCFSFTENFLVRIMCACVSRVVTISIGLFSQCQCRPQQSESKTRKKIKQLRLFEYIFKCFSCVCAVIKYKMYEPFSPSSTGWNGSMVFQPDRWRWL